MGPWSHYKCRKCGHRHDVAWCTRRHNQNPVIEWMDRVEQAIRSFFASNGEP